MIKAKKKSDKKYADVLNAMYDMDEKKWTAKDIDRWFNTVKSRVKPISDGKWFVPMPQNSPSVVRKIMRGLGMKIVRLKPGMKVL